MLHLRDHLLEQLCVGEKKAWWFQIFWPGRRVKLGIMRLLTKDIRDVSNLDAGTSKQIHKISFDKRQEINWLPA